MIICLHICLYHYNKRRQSFVFIRYKNLGLWIYSYISTRRKLSRVCHNRGSNHFQQYSYYYNIFKISIGSVHGTWTFAQQMEWTCVVYGRVETSQQMNIDRSLDGIHKSRPREMLHGLTWKRSVSIILWTWMAYFSFTTSLFSTNFYILNENHGGKSVPTK